MRFSFALLVLLAPAPAAAQRLAYEDVLTPATRLAYQPVAVAEAEPMAASTATGSRS